MGVAVVFPGQGTQRPGMGVPWRDEPVWGLVERAETALGRSLAGLLLDSEPRGLERTADAQVAVFLASLLAWEALRPRLEPPVTFAGHSLGQITALVAAQALSFEDGVRLAWRRAELTQNSADRRPGRMAALMGADEALALEACKAAPEACWLANDNAPGQVVIAGTPEGLEAACQAARLAGVRKVIPLAVGGAFHTPLMADAAEALLPEMERIAFLAPAAPVVTNHDAAAHDTATGWPEMLAEHLVAPLRWRASTAALQACGADSFLEVGPGTTLSALVKRCLPGVPVANVGVPADIKLRDTEPRDITLSLEVV
ncbi:MAG: ACP S-malonyltransferase [Acidimicrobiia bacterium]